MPRMIDLAQVPHRTHCWRNTLYSAGSGNRVLVTKDVVPNDTKPSPPDTDWHDLHTVPAVGVAAAPGDVMCNGTEPEKLLTCTRVSTTQARQWRETRAPQAATRALVVRDDLHVRRRRVMLVGGGCCGCSMLKALQHLVLAGLR